MSKSALVVYHGPSCLDGLCAAWAFHRAKVNCEFVVGQYQREQNIDFKDRDVFLVDFSFKRDKMLEIAKEANVVVVLDHHKSALDDLKDIQKEEPKIIMNYANLNHSGARIAWDFLEDLGMLKEERPEIVDIIEDRDMWWFKLPETRAITMALFTYDFSFDLLDDCARSKRFLSKLRMEGECLIRVQDKDIAQTIRTTKRYMMIGGHSVPVINCSPKLVSEACNKMAQDQLFSAAYWDNAYNREFSLRSVEGGADVSVIAATYGGGGHPRAAGFKVPRDHELAKL